MLHRISYYLFLAIILIAPFPFASNRPWSETLLIVCIGALIILEALSSDDQAMSNQKFIYRILPGLLMWAAVLGWAWVQATPGLADSFVHPLWQEVTKIIGRPVDATISLDPEATKFATVRLLAFGAVFWISARFCRDPEKAALTFKVFVIASGLYALYGLVAFFAGNQTILWFDKWAYTNDLTSTFVNRNNYATFAGLGFIAGLAMLIEQVSRQSSGQSTLTKVARIWLLSTAPATGRTFRTETR